MTELECPALYELGERCGVCAGCLALQDLAEWSIDGSPSDLDSP
jgi:hypothetical protein